jgi:hypothetical protein
MQYKIIFWDTPTESGRLDDTGRVCVEMPCSHNLFERNRPSSSFSSPSSPSQVGIKMTSRYPGQILRMKLSYLSSAVNHVTSHLRRLRQATSFPGLNVLRISTDLVSRLFNDERCGAEFYLPSLVSVSTALYHYAKCGVVATQHLAARQPFQNLSDLIKDSALYQHPHL